MSRYHPWLVWGIAALFYAFAFFHRVSPAAMIPEVMHDLHVPATSLSFFAYAYFLAYSIFQIPAGLIADHVPFRRFLLFAIAIATSGVFLGSFSHEVHTAYLSRALIGLGSAFGFIGCIKVGLSWFPPKKLPFVVGLTDLFGVLGAILAGLPLSYLIANLGWRSSLMLLGLIGTVIWLVSLLLLKEGPYQHTPTSKDCLSYRQGLWQIITHKQTWILALYGSMLVAPIAAFGELWSTPFLTKAYSIDRSDALLANTFIFIGIASGGPIIGWLASKNFLPAHQLMRLFTLIAFLCFSCVLLSPVTNYVLLCILLFIYGLATSNMLLCFSFAALYHPASRNGTAIGFINTIVMMSAVAQPIVGKVLDVYASQPFSLSDYRMALSGLPLCILLAFFLSYKIQQPQSLR